ncbi:hypothetical protein [Limosilactobacillus reuteri]
MKKYLDDHGIAYASTDTKDQLLAKLGE